MIMSPMCLCPKNLLVISFSDNKPAVDNLIPLLKNLKILMIVLCFFLVGERNLVVGVTKE